MDGKQKRSYAIRGCYQQKNNFGTMYDKTEQRHEMPNIGDKVIVMENTQLERSKDGVAAKYTISNSYLDARGKPEIFEVVGFSRGRDDPLAEGNSIELYRKFDKNEKYGHRTQIPCVRVCVGNVHLLPVNKLLEVHDQIEDALDALALSNGIASDYGANSKRVGRDDSFGKE